METFRGTEPRNSVEQRAVQALEELRKQEPLVPDEVVKLREMLDDLKDQTAKLKEQLEDLQKKSEAEAEAETESETVDSSGEN